MQCNQLMKALAGGGQCQSTHQIIFRWSCGKNSRGANCSGAVQLCGAARCSVPRVCGAADLFILVQLTCHQATTTTRGNISASKKVHPKDRNHGEGPYYGLLLVESAYKHFHI